jgi:hypothetical protein
MLAGSRATPSGSSRVLNRSQLPLALSVGDPAQRRMPVVDGSKLVSVDDVPPPAAGKPQRRMRWAPSGRVGGRQQAAGGCATLLRCCQNGCSSCNAHMRL